MSEPITDAPAADQPQPEPAKPDTGDKDWAAEAEKWKALARKHEAKSKELEPLATKAKELEDAGRTELEKLTARAELAERTANENQARALRLEVAFEKGLTPAQAKRLVGASREELEADAEEILRDFPVKSDGRPKGSADLGARPVPLPSNPKLADLAQIEADLGASRRK